MSFGIVTRKRDTDLCQLGWGRFCNHAGRLFLESGALIGLGSTNSDDWVNEGRGVTTR